MADQRLYVIRYAVNKEEKIGVVLPNRWSCGN